MQQQPTYPNPSPTVVKQSLRVYWKFLLGFFIALLIVFGFKAAETVGEFLNKKWEEGGFAYDVKTEYFVAGFSGGIRRQLVYRGWDQNGAIPSLLSYIHGKAYDSAMKKIPEEDGERELWYFDYKIYPKIRNNDISALDTMMPDVLEKFFIIIDKPIKSMRLREIEKYDTLRLLFNYFFTNKDLFPATETQRQQWTESFIEEGINLASKMNVQKIASDDLYKMTPPRFIESLTTVTSQRIKSEHFDCNQTDIQRFKYLHNKMQETILLYSRIRLNREDAAILNKVNYHADTMHSAVSSILHQKCHITF